MKKSFVFSLSVLLISSMLTWGKDKTVNQRTVSSYLVNVKWELESAKIILNGEEFELLYPSEKRKENWIFLPKGEMQIINNEGCVSFINPWSIDDENDSPKIHMGIDNPSEEVVYDVVKVDSSKLVLVQSIEKKDGNGKVIYKKSSLKITFFRISK